jgi:SAM-dependent methyltransferase
MSTHSIDADNQAAWTRILLANELAYPDEQIVRFLAARYGETGVPAGANGLDVGFGSGRHLKLLMDYGFKAHGLEVVPEALDVAGRRFGGDPLLGELKVADMRAHPFPDGFFEVAVAWGVVFLRPPEEILADLRALHRMLAPGGGLAVNFRTHDNWLVGRGRQISPSTWVLDEQAADYAGITYTFLTDDQAVELLEGAGFTIDDYQRVELWRDRGTRRHSWWSFWVTRPDR